MNPWVIAMVAGAGGLGAATRFILDGLITSRVHTRIPLGTMVINVSGSFLLGLLTGVALSMALHGADAFIACGDSGARASGWPSCS